MVPRRDFTQSCSSPSVRRHERREGNEIGLMRTRHRHRKHVAAGRNHDRIEYIVLQLVRRSAAATTRISSRCEHSVFTASGLSRGTTSICARRSSGEAGPTHAPERVLAGDAVIDEPDTRTGEGLQSA